MSDTDKPQEPRRVRRPWALLPWQRVDIIDSNVVDQRRDSSLVASAQRIIQTKLKGGSQRRTEAWMGEAWTMYDLVGELHFLATTLARRASRARFYVGKVEGTDVMELEAPLDAEKEGRSPAELKQEKKAQVIFDSLGDGFIGVQEIVERAFLNQFVVGACYMVGAPPEIWKQTQGTPRRAVKDVPLNELVWKTLSVTEFVRVSDGYELRQNGSTAEENAKVVKIPGSAVYVISLWTSHPQDASVPDSPVRASLPVLRELVGLTQHVSAQIDSRLAGAGLLVMRSSASRAIKRALNIPEDDTRDVFTEMLIDAMVTPIADRDSASAIVPLVITIPDEAGLPVFISFDAPLDQYAAALREESIRRIALGLDAPPELLLGQGTTTHWTAWLTQEEVVDSHISPTLALIARGLTTEFLRPILRANGLSVAEAEKYAIWFDTSELTVKANIAADSRALHEMGLVSDETVRRANGFDESDAPKKADVKEQAIDMVKEMVVANPGLMNRPGLDVLVSQITALLSGTPQSGISAAKAAIASSGSDDIAGDEDAADEAQAAIEAPGAVADPGTTPPSQAPPGRTRAPSTTVSTPGIPQTAKPAAADSQAFGSFD